VHDLLPGQIGDIADRVRSGTLSASVVLESFVERIETLNPNLNALVSTRLEGARADARRLDELVTAGKDPGPLAGIPFTAKDVLATEDLPTTCGSRTLSGNRTGYDATVVARARAAGAILVGKTNTPEFAFGLDTDNLLHGRTRNPLGPFTPGGSSGGEAAAVAAGLSAFGLGSDFGGSIRWPAQCTALVGVRPTVGRVPGTGQLPGLTGQVRSVPDTSTLQGLVQVIGPLARSVADAAAVLRVLCGPDGQDPAAVAEPLNDYTQVALGSLELRWDTSVAGFESDPEVVGAVTSAADVLSRHVGQVHRGLPDAVHAAADVYSRLRDTDPLTEIRQAVSGRRDQVGAHIRSLLANEVTVDDRRLADLFAERDRLIRDLSSWLHGERILLLPVAYAPPFDDLDSITVRGQALSGFELVTPSRAISLFGLPAVSVPHGRTADGRPLSVQVVAPPFREDLALAAAGVLEAVGSIK
jgi:amidase